MPINATKIHEEIRRKLNRVNSDYYKSVSVSDLDAYFNEAKDVVFENFAAVAERNTTVRNHLRQLEKKNVTLNVTTQDSDVYFATYPPDFYRLLRQTALVSKKGCSQKRELIIHIFQTDDLSESLKDPFWKPSWDYEETLGDEAGDGLMVYSQGDFVVESVKVDYIKKIRDIATPSLALNGTYTNSSGQPVTQNIDLEIDSTYLWRKMVDVAVLTILRDVNDVQDYQTQLQKLLQLDKMFLV